MTNPADFSSFDPRCHLLRVDKDNKVRIENRGIKAFFSRIWRIVKGESKLADYKIENVFRVLSENPEYESVRQNVMEKLRGRLTEKYPGGVPGASKWTGILKQFNALRLPKHTTLVPVSSPPPPRRAQLSR